jgi:hypothetical protein
MPSLILRLFSFADLKDFQSELRQPLSFLSFKHFVLTLSLANCLIIHECLAILI